MQTCLTQRHWTTVICPHTIYVQHFRLPLLSDSVEYYYISIINNLEENNFIYSIVHLDARCKSSRVRIDEEAMYFVHLVSSSYRVTDVAKSSSGLKLYVMTEFVIFNEANQVYLIHY